MGYYFNDLDAVYSKSHGNIARTLSIMASRYMGENPEEPYSARPFTTCGIIRNKDYRYVFNGNDFYPDAANGSYVYAWGKIRRAAQGSLRFLLIPYGPVKIWMNGKEVFATTFEDERYTNKPVTIDLPVEKGWNHLVLRFTKTKAGFGAEFGTWLGKLDYYFMHGRTEYESMEGFDFSEPTREHITDFPPENDAYENFGFASKMRPIPSWNENQKNLGVIGRIFSNSKNLAGKKIAARSRFTTYSNQKISVQVESDCKAKIFIDENPVDSENGANLSAGIHEILVLLSVPENLKNSSDSKNPKIDFSCRILDASSNEISLENPLLVDNVHFAWIFAGPFEKTPDETLLHFSDDKLVGAENEKTWWRLDLPGGWVRLYNENALWGHWDYPLGVTLYGMIETSRQLNDKAIKNYVENHVKKAVGTLEYALFDRDHFGGATCVHHLLSSIDSLDDCGSFGSLMLETSKDCKIGNFAPIADYVGEYICKKQARLEDGSFFRKQMMHKFHNGTMWADDLYMSVPFLCRYAKFKKDDSILDDAALQFLGFKKRLYMPEKKLMAHVYDFNREMNTGVPWGRGNGWTIFSLSELLQVLPENHKMKPELLAFFKELAEGYLSVQDESGMWHQVLDMPESYPESSCTSMFICAFSRGIRNGWLDDQDSRFRKSAMKAWNALERTAIDYKGNLYGVCRGSEFAFNPTYYSEHLLPQLNNTHGIGITLLAGVEMMKLNEFKK